MGCIFGESSEEWYEKHITGAVDCTDTCKQIKRTPIMVLARSLQTKVSLGHSNMIRMDIQSSLMLRGSLSLMSRT
jgi:hypothetical protein